MLRASRGLVINFNIAIAAGSASHVASVISHVQQFGEIDIMTGRHHKLTHTLRILVARVIYAYVFSARVVLFYKAHALY